ncbi:TIGR01457 family HAD-type hydrolase [Paenibacillus polymyxa]|uniref:TIGR01457 family HAD-type hydrolase n=1 Tax=Paenibacillus polymyxa TaxID=1406 RepID=UPI00234A3BAF|nr:TIGR01457 family HAD-type hydrolase [Paenibacillus polymyxa]WCM59175.1 TIGR01457 family HAD-type hydrolase [Paenibacillus polymyxa]
MNYNFQCYVNGFEVREGIAIKSLLIDLDGTLYHGNRMIKGADLFISRLRTDQIPYAYVTNNASRTPESVAEHLVGMGIEAASHEVYTSALAAAQYVAQQSPGARVYCIGETGLRDALTGAGLQLVENHPDYVVQGIDRQFTYDALAAAMRWIREGATFILTNPDLQLPSHDGLTPGAGTIGAAIEAASQVKPIVIGKPSSVLMNYALNRLNIRADEALVVGDNMLTDIAAGAAAGCKTALILSGVTTRANMDEHVRTVGVKPDLMFENLAELQDWMKEELK